MLDFANTTEVMQSAAPANMTPAQQLADAINSNKGVVNMSNGVIYDIFTIPTSVTATISSAAGAGAGAKTVYLFGTSTLNAAVTDNGSGANSIVTTYGDGFSGNVYQKLFDSANNGRGIKINGFTVIATVASTGAQTATPLNTLAMNIINANGQGGTLPIAVDVAEAIRNTQYQSGTLTVGKSWYQNALNQLQFYLGVDVSLSWTFFTSASGFKG